MISSDCFIKLTITEANAFDSVLADAGIDTARLWASAKTTPPNLSVIEGTNTKTTRIGSATLKGDPALIRAEASAGSHPNSHDMQGYTACHMAAMTDRIDLLKLLWQLGGSLEKKTNQGLSVIDILKARGFGKPISTPVTVLQNVKVPIAEVKRVIGRTYLSDNIYSSEALLIQWSNCLQNSRNGGAAGHSNFNAAFETFKKIKEGQQPYDPPVFIRKMGPTSKLAGQWELVASRDIKAGELLLEYTGHVRQCGDELSDHAMGCAHDLEINATDAGSFAELANQGPPNAFCQSVIYKGLERSILVATKPIPKGTPIQINYGRGYFDGRRIEFKELNPEEVERFVRHTNDLTDFQSWAETENLNQYLPCARTEHKDTQLPDISLYTEEMKIYLYEFPDHLFTMVKAGTLAAQQLRAFFRECVSSGLPAQNGINPLYDPESNLNFMLQI